jgi:hypothetical protein
MGLGPVCMEAENLSPTTVIRSPDRPDRGESLYRLSYPPGPQKNLYMFYYIPDENLHWVGHYFSGKSLNFCVPMKVQWLDPPISIKLFSRNLGKRLIFFYLYVHKFETSEATKACIKLSPAVPSNDGVWSLLRPGNTWTRLRNSIRTLLKESLTEWSLW